MKELSKFLPAENKNRGDPNLLLEVTDKVSEAHDNLWLKHKDKLKLAVVRDKQYFDWRYSRHPKENYRFLSVSKTGVLVASIAFRERWIETESHKTKDFILMDLVTDYSDLENLENIILCVETKIRNYGFSRMIARFPGNHRLSALFTSKLDYVEIETNQTAVGIVFKLPYLQNFSNSSFFYTLGDWDVL